MRDEARQQPKKASWFGVLAVILMVLPVPASWNGHMPMWLLLVALYGAIKRPLRYGVVRPWLWGLLADMMTGGWLGLQALLYMLMSYLLSRGYRRVQLYRRWQQSLLVLLIVFIVSCVNLHMLAWRRDITTPALPFVTAITSALFWHVAFWVRCWLYGRGKLHSPMSQSPIQTTLEI